jgi:hypothetical protein
MNFTYSQIMLKLLKIKNFQFSFTTLFYKIFNLLLFMFNEGVFKSFKHPSMYPKKNKNKIRKCPKILYNNMHINLCKEFYNESSFLSHAY